MRRAHWPQDSRRVGSYRAVDFQVVGGAELLELLGDRHPLRGGGYVVQHVVDVQAFATGYDQAGGEFDFLAEAYKVLNGVLLGGIDFFRAVLGQLGGPGVKV